MMDDDGADILEVGCLYSLINHEIGRKKTAMNMREDLD